MKSKSGYAILVLAFTLLLAACGAGTGVESEIATSVAQTQQISALETAAAGGGAAQGQSDAADEGAEADVEEVGTPMPSETPTITLTPTLDIPLVSVSQATNCRTGPASGYGFKTTVNAGDELEVVGVWAEGNEYLIVDYGGGLTCWLWTRYTDKTDFSAYDLPAFDTPPTPTPTYTPTPSFDWSGTWQMWISGIGSDPASFVVAGNNVTGSYMQFGVNFTLTGTISNGGQNLSGTWSSAVPSNGTFQFQIKSGNLNQFVGNIDGISSWCGARGGASMPSPCQWP